MKTTNINMICIGQNHFYIHRKYYMWRSILNFIKQYDLFERELKRLRYKHKEPIDISAFYNISFDTLDDEIMKFTHK